MGATLSKNLPPLTKNVVAIIGLGGGIESVPNDVVANVSTSGVSLKLNDKVRLTVLDTGKVVKISNEKQTRLLLSLGHGHSFRPLSRASVSCRNF